MTVEVETIDGSMAIEKTIPLAEIFGPTIQGEGALAGRPTYFLRVGGCDYKCLWCDTGFSVNPEEVRKLERKTPYEITNRLAAWQADHPGATWLSISGGNPAMYDLSEIVTVWPRLIEGGRITVETQGSRWQPWLAEVDMLTISPKPPSSGMGGEQSMDNLERFHDQLSEARHQQFKRYIDGEQQRGFGHCLKVICFDELDYEFAQMVHQTYPGVPFYLSCGTAMGGLSGKWVPPPIPDLVRDDPPYLGEADLHKQKREHPNVNWFAPATDTKEHLLRRYRWLVERAASDPVMADAAIFPQLHALIWGINTKGV